MSIIDTVTTGWRRDIASSIKRVTGLLDAASWQPIPASNQKFPASVANRTRGGSGAKHGPFPDGHADDRLRFDSRDANACRPCLAAQKDGAVPARRCRRRPES